MHQERGQAVESGPVTFPGRRQKFTVTVLSAIIMCPNEVLRTERPKVKKILLIFELPLGGNTAPS